MARAGSVLVGRHDFSAFGAADRQPVRTLHWVRVRRAGSLVTIDVAADAFLRGMVRRIVAALLEVGRGTLDEAAVARGACLAAAGPQRGRRSGQGAVPATGRPGTDGRSNDEHGCRRGPGSDRRTMSNARTYTLRESEIERRWFVVDATDQTLGRLASRIARVLEGKHKPTYTPILDRATT